MECIFYFFFSSEPILEGEEVLNTAVIGASLYNAANNQPIEPKEVLITFRTENSRVNITGKTQEKQFTVVARTNKTNLILCSEMVFFKRA